MPLRRDKKIDLLRGVSIFERASKNELARVAAVACEEHYPQAVTLVREGQHDDGFFISGGRLTCVARDGC